MILRLQTIVCIFLFIDPGLPSTCIGTVIKKITCFFFITISDKFCNQRMHQNRQPPVGAHCHAVWDSDNLMPVRTIDCGGWHNAVGNSKKIYCPSWRSLTEIVGSGAGLGVGSGSESRYMYVGQRYGSKDSDPDQYQNVTDRQHW
jgi:hypothetical protein